MAQEPISGGAYIGQELMDRAGRGGCLQESALHIHDQVAADAALLDHVGVPVEAAEVRQVEVEGGEIGQAADLLQASRLLEVGLQGEEVGSGARVREMEDGLVHSRRWRSRYRSRGSRRARTCAIRGGSSKRAPRTARSASSL